MYKPGLIRALQILLIVFAGGFACHYALLVRLHLTYSIELYNPETNSEPLQIILDPNVGKLVVASIGVTLAGVTFALFSSDNLLSKCRWPLTLGLLTATFTGQYLKLLMRDFAKKYQPGTGKYIFASFSEIRNSLSYIEQVYYLPLVNAVERGCGTEYLLAYSFVCALLATLLDYIALRLLSLVRKKQKNLKPEINSN